MQKKVKSVLQLAFYLKVDQQLLEMKIIIVSLAHCSSYTVLYSWWE